MEASRDGNHGSGSPYHSDFEVNIISIEVTNGLYGVDSVGTTICKRLLPRGG